MFFIESPLRFETLANRKVAVFSDNLFADGNEQATLRIARQLAKRREAEVGGGGD